MFKRFYWSGSDAKYVAATWHGNDSQISGWVPLVGGATPNYYINVEHAFSSAEELAIQIGDLDGSTYVAAHSLGNMLVSSAIVDHGLNVEAYFMLNAAVAMEAYDSTISHRDNMRNPDWQSYSNRLWASDWYDLFPVGDNRRSLTWKDRFGNISVALNYYSEGEDVLDNGTGSMPSLGSEGAWVSQEMRKGTWMITVGPGNSEAGWGFNSDYDHLTVGEANALLDSTIQTNSLFKSFDSSMLYTSLGSSYLLDNYTSVFYSPVYSRLIADAVPALSQPSGRNKIDIFTNSRNKNMNDMQNGWPQSRWNDADLQNRWLHSDIVNIAFLYVHSVFSDIATKGIK